MAEFEEMAGWDLIIVGDKKSKPIESSKNLTVAFCRAGQTHECLFSVGCCLNRHVDE